MYYSTPTHREYFVINDSIEIIINCDSNIIKTLEKGIEDNNIAYLGNSEGWIHLEVEAYE
jgi:CRISPR-associated protein Cas5